MMGFDARGSVQTMPPFTCSKIKVGRLARPTFILALDNERGELRGGILCIKND